MDAPAPGSPFPGLLYRWELRGYVLSEAEGLVSVLEGVVFSASPVFVSVLAFLAEGEPDGERWSVA